MKEENLVHRGYRQYKHDCALYVRQSTKQTGQTIKFVEILYSFLTCTFYGLDFFFTLNIKNCGSPAFLWFRPVCFEFGLWYDNEQVYYSGSLRLNFRNIWNVFEDIWGMIRNGLIEKYRKV